MQKKNRVKLKYVNSIVIPIVIQLVLIINFVTFTYDYIRYVPNNELEYHTEIVKDVSRGFSLSRNDRIVIFVESRDISFSTIEPSDYHPKEVMQIIEPGHEITYGVKKNFWGEEMVMTMEYEGLIIQYNEHQGALIYLLAFFAAVCVPELLFILIVHSKCNYLWKEMMRARRFEKRRKRKAKAQNDKAS